MLLSFYIWPCHMFAICLSFFVIGTLCLIFLFLSLFGYLFVMFLSLFCPFWSFICHLGLSVFVILLLPLSYVIFCFSDEPHRKWKKSRKIEKWQKKTKTWQKSTNMTKKWQENNKKWQKIEELRKNDNTMTKNREKWQNNDKKMTKTWRKIEELRKMTKNDKNREKWQENDKTMTKNRGT